VWYTDVNELKEHNACTFAVVEGRDSVLVYIYQNKRCHNAEDHDMNLQHYETSNSILVVRLILMLSSKPYN